MSCITADNLYKYYGSVRAIDGISLNVDYGKVFGFLGPNGAGKTTAIKIFTTLIQPTSGKVNILGYDLLKQPNMIKQRIGVVQQKPSFESNLTVEGSLDLYGKLWNISDGERNKRVQDLLKMFAIEDIRNVKNEELSIGQRRRVQVAREFMHDMDLLFLDEPTVGLDPSARRTLLDYIKERVREGLTVFFTTHIMEEAEYLCDEIAIINKGKIIALDTPSGLKQKFGGVKVVEIKLKEPFNGIEKIVSSLGIASVELQDSTSIKISAENAEQILISVIELLNKNNAQVASISVNPPSLEEIFLAMVDDANGSSS
ncbi:MAG: ATP-binding cassette domain-containing protein [Nitrososphaerales archaeon]